MRNILWLTFIFLVSCSKSVSEQGKVSDTSGVFTWDRYKDSEITVLFNNHPYADAIKKRIQDFENLTGIKVKFSDTPEENYFDKVSTTLTSRTGLPDIFMSGAYQLWDYASAGYVEPLEPFINNSSLTAEDYNVNDFFPGVLDSLKWDLVPGNPVGTGDLWALPMGFELYSLAYNKKVFEEKGLSPPTTIREMIDTAASLQEFDGPGTYGISLRGTRSWATIHPEYITTYANYGAKDIVKKDGKLISVVNSPEAIRMTKDWIKLIRNGGAPTWSTYTWYQVGTDMGAKKAAMAFAADNTMYFQNFPGSSQESGNIAWVPAPLPEGTAENQRKSNLWIWSMAMNASSKNKGAAWLFLQYFTNREYQLWSVTEDKAVDPPRKSVFNDPKFQEIASKAEGYLESFEKTINGTSILFTPQPHFFELTTEWAATLQSIVAGDYATVEEGMNSLKEKMDEVLSEL